MKKKILYIISSGRSGSTLLCKFLGMHSQCFALSEPQRYDMATRTNGFCSCSETLLDCQFWGAVRCNLEAAGYEGGRMDTSQFPFYTGKSFLRKFQAFLGLFLFAKGFGKLIDKGYYQQLCNEAKLLQTVSIVSDKPVLVDASKSLVRAIGLSRMLKDDYESHFIHLYREPVSVVYSSLKKNMSVKLEDREIVYSKKKLPTLEEATENWCRGNNSNLVLCEIFGINPMYLCYETFTKDPKAAFLKVGQELGLKWEEGMLDLSQGGHHMVSGNLSRINAKSVNAPKDEWKNMGADKQAYVRDETSAVLKKIEARADR